MWVRAVGCGGISDGVMLQYAFVSAGSRCGYVLWAVGAFLRGSITLRPRFCAFLCAAEKAVFDLARLYDGTVSQIAS